MLGAHSMTLSINLDVDAANRPVGVELLGLAQAEPEQLLRAIASGNVTGLLAAAGYEIRRLRDNHAISVRHISWATAACIAGRNRPPWRSAPAFRRSCPCR